MAIKILAAAGIIALIAWTWVSVSMLEGRFRLWRRR